MQYGDEVHTQNIFFCFAFSFHKHNLLAHAPHGKDCRRDNLLIQLLGSLIDTPHIDLSQYVKVSHRMFGTRTSCMQSLLARPQRPLRKYGMKAGHFCCMSIMAAGYPRPAMSHHYLTGIRTKYPEMYEGHLWKIIIIQNDLLLPMSIAHANLMLMVSDSNKLIVHVKGSTIISIVDMAED